MIGHQAGAEEVGREAASGLGEGLDEGVVVGGVGEDRPAAVAAIRGVVDQATDGSSGGSGQGSRRERPSIRVDYSLRPFSSRLFSR